MQIHIDTSRVLSPKGGLRTEKSSIMKQLILSKIYARQNGKFCGERVSLALKDGLD